MPRLSVEAKIKIVPMDITIQVTDKFYSTTNYSWLWVLILALKIINNVKASVHKWLILNNMCAHIKAPATVTQETLTYQGFTSGRVCDL